MQILRPINYIVKAKKLAFYTPRNYTIFKQKLKSEENSEDSYLDGGFSPHTSEFKKYFGIEKRINILKDLNDKKSITFIKKVTGVLIAIGSIGFCLVLFIMTNPNRRHNLWCSYLLMKVKLYRKIFFRAKDWNARKASLINMKDNFLQIKDHPLPKQCRKLTKLINLDLRAILTQKHLHIFRKDYKSAFLIYKEIMGELNDYYVLLNFLIDGAALNEQPLFIYLFIKELAKLGELLHELYTDKQNQFLTQNEIKENITKDITSEFYIKLICFVFQNVEYSTPIELMHLLNLINHWLRHKNPSNEEHEILLQSLAESDIYGELSGEKGVLPGSYLSSILLNRFLEYVILMHMKRPKDGEKEGWEVIGGKIQRENLLRMNYHLDIEKYIRKYIL